MWKCRRSLGQNMGWGLWPGRWAVGLAGLAVTGCTVHSPSNSLAMGPWVRASCEHLALRAQHMVLQACILQLKAVWGFTVPVPVLSRYGTLYQAEPISNSQLLSRPWIPSFFTCLWYLEPAYWAVRVKFCCCLHKLLISEPQLSTVLFKSTATVAILQLFADTFQTQFC